MSKYNLDFGKSSESEAVAYLKKRGYKILGLNYRTALGEIDIVARDRGTLCFVEVKSRSSLSHGHPKEALTNTKQHKIVRSALVYMKENNLLKGSCRFDVLSILRRTGERNSIELLKCAFEASPNYTY